MRNKILLNLAVLLVTTVLASAATRLVPEQYDTIQAAIDDCNDGDVVVIAPGTYIGPGNRDIAFKGKPITVRSSDPNDPDIVAATIIDCNGTPEDPHRGFHFRSYEGPNSVIAGLTITNGFGPEEQDAVITSVSSRGGAILCIDSNPTIANCIISNNLALVWGGAIYSIGGSPMVIYCTFSSNQASAGSEYGGWGGAIFWRTGSPKMTNSTFIDNRAKESGGAICGSGSEPEVANCIFSNNSANTGGAVCIYHNMTLTNCTFNGNSAGNVGGAIHCEGYSEPKITNCIIIGNSARLAGGIYCDHDNSTISNCFVTGNVAAHASNQSRGGGISFEHSSAVVKNCLITGNSAEYGGGVCFYYCNAELRHCTVTNNSATESGDGISCFGDSRPEMTPQIYNSIIWGNSGSGGPDMSSDVPVISYSDIDGGYRGIGNINADPLFVNPDNNDFHLLPSSPCIDAGDSEFVPNIGETDRDLEPRVMGLRVDIGADEFLSTPTPVIGISPKLFVFNADEGRSDPNVQLLFVFSAGTANLTWELSENSPWLQAYPISGESPGDSDEVSLSVDISGLAPGKYTCEVIITAFGAPNSPQKIPIALYIRSTTSILNVPSQYETIQSAINSANNGDIVILSPGIYNGLENRDLDFKGKAITVQSINPNDPDIVASTIIDCEGQSRGFNFHSGEETNSILSGLTITSGSAKDGSGINIQSSSPVITRCNITNNSSNEDGRFGGGLCITDGFPIISYCTILDNSTDWSGGGIFSNDSSPIIINCTISHNRAFNEGAGICCWGGNPFISNCVIRNNIISYRRGGGIACRRSNLTITDCIIADNIARYSGGGGIWLVGANAKINQCTITGNSTEYVGGGVYFELGDATITNCILENNTAPNGSEIAVNSWSGVITERSPDPEPYPISFLTISYSNVQGGQNEVYVYNQPGWFLLNWGHGNIDIVPYFADPNNGDYHLKSQAGRWDSTSESWIQDEVTSPCIDAGDPGSPIGHEAFPNGGIINMGAYGGRVGASKSYFGEPVCEKIVAGDINGDCKVDFEDFKLMVLHWLEDANQ